jgi:hypothetical protein
MSFDDVLAQQLQHGVFTSLATVRSRRVGAGYRVDSGLTEQHPVSGREMSQDPGPQAFVSELPPQPLSEDEQALLAWAICGPNGVVAWEASVSGSFSQLVSLRGRTAPEPNNTLATDLLVIDDTGVQLYRPTSPWPVPGQRIDRISYGSTGGRGGCGCRHVGRTSTWACVCLTLLVRRWSAPTSTT